MDSALQAGADFRFETALPDGRVATIRPIRAEDADGLRQAFERLSEQSRHTRFLAHGVRLTDAMTRYLTDVDGKKHVALVATVPSLDLKTEEGIGVARFIRLDSDPAIAEAAITVVDDHQGRGLGTVLAEQLAKVGVARGVRAFRGEVLASNASILSLLRDAGATIEFSSDGQRASFDVPLEPGTQSLREQGRDFIRQFLRILQGDTTT